MCEFCHRHGEGQKWYLAASNYSEELFQEASRKSAARVLSELGGAEARRKHVSTAERIGQRLPMQVLRWVGRRYQQDVHWGQVVPLEDANAIVDLVDWVIRLPCVCRASTIGDRNARYCFGVGVAAVEEPWRRLFREAIGPSLSVETLTKDQAKAALADLDHRGAMHSVWTFKSPFIGGLCNCDRDCGAYRAQLGAKFQVMFRAEYVARVDPDACRGCRRRMQQCLFGAVTHSLTQGKCAIDESHCYGCGLCRAVCDRQAISLVPRASVPAVANVWDL